MNNSNVKAIIAKGMAVGLLAGAFVMTGTSKAQAQGLGVGIQIGYPHYDYSRRDAYEHQRFEQARREQFERQQAFARHEAWERHERIEAMRAREFRFRHGYEFEDRDEDRRYRHEDGREDRYRGW